MISFLLNKNWGVYTNRMKVLGWGTDSLPVQYLTLLKKSYDFAQKSAQAEKVVKMEKLYYKLLNTCKNLCK